MTTSTITWTPVSEGLPDVESNVLLGLSSGYSCEGFLDTDHHGAQVWRDVCAVEIEDAVVAWAELPMFDSHADTPAAAPAPGDRVMVPREPTPEMLRAGQSCKPVGKWHRQISQVWTAMLGSAPTIAIQWEAWQAGARAALAAQPAPADMVMVPQLTAAVDQKIRWIRAGLHLVENKLAAIGTADDETQLVNLRSSLQSLDQLAEMIAAAPAPAVPADQWKAAIDDELVCCHIGTTDSFPDAKAALKNLIDWHVSVALDPAVSSDAQALIDKGKSAASAVPAAGKPCEYNGGTCTRRSCVAGHQCQAMMLSAAPAVREPLTPPHMLQIGRKHFGHPTPQAWFDAARELEQAHGIGGGGK